MNKIFANQLYATNTVQSLQMPTITWSFDIDVFKITTGVSLQVFVSNKPVEEINSFADMSTDSEKVTDGGSVIGSDDNYAMPVNGNFRYIAFKARYNGSVVAFSDELSTFEDKILNAQDGDLAVFNNDYPIPESLQTKFDYFNDSVGITHVAAGTHLYFNNGKWCDLVKLYQSDNSPLKNVVKHLGA